MFMIRLWCYLTVLWLGIISVAPAFAVGDGTPAARVPVVQMFKNSSVVTSDTAALSGSGFLQCIMISQNDGAVGQFQLNSGSGTDGISSTAILPTQDGDYLFGTTWGTDLQCITVTAGTGWTGDTLSGCNPYTEHIIQGTAASTAATFTDGNSSTDHITFIQAFKVAPAGALLQFSPGALGVIIQ